MLVSAYMAKVKQDHKSKTIRLYFLTYEWFWFHTEFWLKPIDRRPYTFIFRDEIFQRPARSIPIIIAVTGLLIWLTILAPGIGFLDILYGFLFGHLVWNKDYVPNEQEEPPYLGEKKC